MNDDISIGPVIKAVRAVEKFLNFLAGLTLLAMMFVGAADVIGRYLFSKPIIGVLEASQLMMGGVVFLAWGYTLSKKAHVSVDVIFVLYPKRIQALLRAVMMVVAFILFAVIVWKTGAMALLDWQAGKLVRTIFVPVAPFKAMVPVGGVFLCLECIVQIIQEVPIIIRGEEG